MLSDKPTFEKRPADSVPYGDAISRRGGYVWVACDGERVICVAATGQECRRKYWKLWHAEWVSRGFVRS